MCCYIDKKKKKKKNLRWEEKENVYGRLCELCTTQGENPCVVSVCTCVLNDNYKQAWRHERFVMQILKGHGQNTMGCICWQKNKLGLANKSREHLNSSQKNDSSASGFYAFMSEWESWCFGVMMPSGFRFNVKVLYTTNGCNWWFFLVYCSIICGVKSQKIVVHHNFPEPKVTSSNYLFNPKKPKIWSFLSFKTGKGRKSSHLSSWNHKTFGIFPW